MERNKTNPPETVLSLEDVANSRQGLSDKDKKDLLEVAHAHGLTATGMQEIFDILDTANLPSSSFNPNPLVSAAIDKASPEAMAVYGEFLLKILDRNFETE